MLKKCGSRALYDSGNDGTGFLGTFKASVAVVLCTVVVIEHPVFMVRKCLLW